MSGSQLGQELCGLDHLDAHLAGGAYHTSFSYAVTAEHLRDFTEMAGIEFLLIDEHTCVEEFKDKLRWNDLYYLLNKGT